MKFAQPKLSPTDRIGVTYDTEINVHTREFDSLSEAQEFFQMVVGPFSTEAMNTTTYSHDPECFEKFETKVAGRKFACWMHVVV